MFAAQLLSWAMKTPIFIFIILLMFATRAYAQGTHDTLDDPFLKLEDLDGAESEDWTVSYEELSDLAENKIDSNSAKEEDLLRRGREAGAYLKEGLEKIAAEFPSVITEVRGRGMMLGIELTKEGAGGMLMSLMIMKHIIVAYTLNNPKVIRMEPPLIMPKEVIDHVLEEFRDAVAQTADVIEDL